MSLLLLSYSLTNDHIVMGIEKPSKAMPPSLTGALFGQDDREQAERVRQRRRESLLTSASLTGLMMLAMVLLVVFLHRYSKLPGQPTTNPAPMNCTPAPSIPTHSGHGW
jgi:hypothetical protein